MEDLQEDGQRTRVRARKRLDEKSCTARTRRESGINKEGEAMMTCFDLLPHSFLFHYSYHRSGLFPSLLRVPDFPSCRHGSSSFLCRTPSMHNNMHATSVLQARCLMCSISRFRTQCRKYHEAASVRATLPCLST